MQHNTIKHNTIIYIIKQSFSCYTTQYITKYHLKNITTCYTTQYLTSLYNIIQQNILLNNNISHYNTIIQYT